MTPTELTDDEIDQVKAGDPDAELLEMYRRGEASTPTDPRGDGDPRFILWATIIMGVVWTIAIYFIWRSLAHR